jgi:hypothetical protein
VDAVRGQQLGLQQVLLLDPRHHRHAQLAAGVLDLEQGFGNVRVEGDVELLGESGAGLEDFRRAGVGGVGRDGRDDEGVVPPLDDELARQGQ